MNSPIIEVEKLKVIYNQGKSNEVRSLDDINIKIYPQEYVIFFGPSGCGKSTLLYSISGLQAPTEGDVKVQDKNISKMTKDELVELHQVGVGMIFQAFYLIPSINVLDNVCLPKVFRGEPGDVRKEAGVKLLHRFGIVEQANKFPSQLSGGQKQRVSIARSLVNDPAIILADEPVGNLDSESAENVLRILKELNEIDKKTIILVTHNAEHLHFADRVIYMKDGKVIREEVHKEKRPVGFKKEEDIKINTEELTHDLKLLMRTFKNLTYDQIGTLLVPFKSNQLLSHALSSLTDEQVDLAGSFLKELLFGNIDLENFRRSLDLDYEKGGAGWNKQRARAFTGRVGEILEQVRILKSNRPAKAAPLLVDYLERIFGLKLEEKERGSFSLAIKARVENKIDRLELERRLDAPKVLGGLGLYKPTAEKVSREMELLMLLKY